MDGYLSKPFVPEVFYDIILEHVSDNKGDSPPIGEDEKKIIGLKFLKKMSAGDENFMKELAETFIKFTPKALAEIRQHHKAEDWIELSRFAHKIKPSVKPMGVELMYNLIVQLEALEKEGAVIDKEPLNHSINQLEQYHKMVTNQLKQELDITQLNNL